MLACLKVCKLCQLSEHIGVTMQVSFVRRYFVKICTFFYATSPIHWHHLFFFSSSLHTTIHNNLKTKIRSAQIRLASNQFSLLFSFINKFFRINLLFPNRTANNKLVLQWNNFQYNGIVHLMWGLVIREWLTAVREERLSDTNKF